MGKHPIRLRAVLPSRNEVQVEIAEDATVRDLKRLICTKVPGLKPAEIRVLQKSMDLNDKGTLEYYRVFDGTKVDIVRKPPSLRAAGDDKSPVAKKAVAPAEETNQRSSTVSAGSRPQSATAKQVTVTDGPGAGPRSRLTNASSTTSTRRAESVSEPAKRSTSRPSSAARTAETSRPSTASDRRPAKPSVGAISDDDDDDESEVLDRVARSVADLKRDLRDSVSSRRHHDTTGTNGDPIVEMLQRRNTSLEDRLRRSEERNELANQRIQELEQTVHRYKLLMRKVSVNMASADML